MREPWAAARQGAGYWHQPRRITTHFFRRFLFRAVIQVLLPFVRGWASSALTLDSWRAHCLSRRQSRTDLCGSSVWFSDSVFSVSSPSLAEGTKSEPSRRLCISVTVPVRGRA